MARGCGGGIGWFTRTIGIRSIGSVVRDGMASLRRGWRYLGGRTGAGRSATGTTYLVVPAPLGQALMLPSRSQRDRRHPIRPREASGMRRFSVAFYRRPGPHNLTN